MPLWLSPIMALFYFRHNPIRRIAPDESVTDSYIEHRMKYRVDDLHTVRLEPNIPDKMDVELLYVAVLDFSDIFHAYLIADILSVHILVVCPC